MMLALVPYTCIWHIISPRERFIGREGGRRKGRDGKKEHLHFSRGWREKQCFPCSTALFKLGKVRKKYSLFCRRPESLFLGGSLTHHGDNQMDAVAAYFW